MKKITLDPYLYDDLVYPAVAAATHTPEEFHLNRMNDRLSKKLEAKGEEQEPDAPETFGYQQHHAPPPMWRLKGDKPVVFELEDAEASYLVRCLKVMMATIQQRSCRKLLPVLEDLGVRFEEE